METNYQYLGSDSSEVEISATVNNLIPNTSYWFELEVYSHVSVIGDLFVSGQQQTFSTSGDSITKGLVIPLQFTNHFGLSVVHRFGVHSAATKCLDTSLGETGLPPLPPVEAMETRFIGNCLDLGTYTDLRPYTSPSQVDTFRVQFQPGSDGYPFHVSWDDLADVYAGSVRLKAISDTAVFSVDMKTSNSFETSDPSINSFSIIAASPRPVTGNPLVSTTGAGFVGNTYCQMEGRINPHGLATRAWFEWGTTTDYDTNTCATDIGNEAGQLPLSVFLSRLHSNTSYHYRAVAQNSAGIIFGVDQSFTTSQVTAVRGSKEMPNKIFLKQNYPNPFNPSTTIEFGLPTQSAVTLRVFNIFGQEVAMLAENRQFLAGEHTLSFNAANFGSGIYFYQISARSNEGKYFQQVKKMVLLK